MPAPDATTPVGTPVHLDFRKYDGAEHWQESYVLLGVDEHGAWLGMPAGTTFAKPDRTITSTSASTRLIPADGGWAAIFNAPAPAVGIHTYIDLTDDPEWSSTDHGLRVTVHDLDLDVVLPYDGEAFIDDEDEFEEHRALFGYPEDLVRRTEAAARDLLVAVQDRREPFGEIAQRWLAQVD